jgi:predicted nucleic acid-binding protein
VRVLVDTNVVLDVLLDRAPFAEGSKQLWKAIETGAAQGFLAAHTLTTVHYLVRQVKGARAARDVVGLVLQVFDIAAVDKSVLDRAVHLEFADFEDAVSASAAEGAACDLIATRNGRDFKRSAVLAVDPITAAALIAARPGRVTEPKAAYAARRRRKQSFVDSIRRSPLARADLTLQRDRSTTRPVKL